MKITRVATPFLVGIFAAAFCFGSFAFVNDAQAKRTKSAAELDAAKKEGDLSEAAAEKTRDAYGKETTEYSIEALGDVKGVKTEAKGNSTYGVTGFDYLTGVGKVADSPVTIKETVVSGMLKIAPIVSQNKSPLENLMKARYKNKWTGQANDTYSGLGEKSGVTEVWFRQHDSGSKLGADYNGWVNQWNNITRPRSKATPVTGADPDQGAHWFSFYCVHCHGWTGKGDGPTAAKLDPRPRNLTNGKYANFISNLDLYTVIKGGGVARNLAEAMPPWGNILQDQDIWNVVAFIRSLSPDYTPDPDDVTAASAATSEAFKEAQEMLELPGVIGGRGSNNQLAYGNQRSGFSSIGGGRLASKKVGVTEGTSDKAAGAKMGDWNEDTK